MQVEIRKIKESDKNFVIATWLKNYRSSSAFAKRINNEVYYKNHHAIVEHILSKPQTTALVVNSLGDEDHLLGFMVYETWPDAHVIHYAFVKIEFQKFGIATQLFHHAKIDPSNFVFTHSTYDAAEILKNSRGTYDPYRL